jgi:hypothetical protein
VFFEHDAQKVEDLHNELLRNNEKLLKEIRELKSKFNWQKSELESSLQKQKDIAAKLKEYERTKQLNDIEITSLHMIKKDCVGEIIKIKQENETLKLDLLAERQLRRFMQKELHKFDRDDENYNTKQIAINSNEETQSHYESLFKKYNISPFLLPSKPTKAFAKELNNDDEGKEGERSKDSFVETKDTLSYNVPNKIFKDCNPFESSAKAMNHLIRKRSLDHHNFFRPPRINLRTNNESRNFTLDLNSNSSSTPISNVINDNVNGGGNCHGNEATSSANAARESNSVFRFGSSSNLSESNGFDILARNSNALSNTRGSSLEQQAGTSSSFGHYRPPKMQESLKVSER